MRAVSATQTNDIMDVLTNVRHDRQAGVVLTFIDSEGEKVIVRLSGNVARDLRDELNDLGENLY